MAGPPTRMPGSTSLTARAVTSYSRQYSAGVPDQNTDRLASFHTSNAQWSRTSSTAVPVDQVRGQGADQVAPSGPSPSAAR